MNYEELCRKMDYDPLCGKPWFVYRGHEDDSQESPYKKLTKEEVASVMEYYFAHRKNAVMASDLIKNVPF